MKVTIDFTKPRGSRVISLEILCRKCAKVQYRELEVDKWYPIVLPSWLLDRDFGYEGLSNLRNRKRGPKDIEVMEQFLKKNNPFRPVLDGRMTIIRGRSKIFGLF